MPGTGFTLHPPVLKGILEFGGEGRAVQRGFRFTNLLTNLKCKAFLSKYYSLNLFCQLAVTKVSGIGRPGSNSQIRLKLLECQFSSISTKLRYLSNY